MSQENSKTESGSTPPNSEPVVPRGLNPVVIVTTLLGIVSLTVVITMWVTRDVDRPGVEIYIPPPKEVTFQISGEVVRPGVYSLEGEPRVQDAVDAAGGFTSDAQHENVNLALHVRDGSKVVIPSLGDISTEVTERTEISPKPGIDSGAASQNSGGGIDLNTASLEQLKSLPGIGDVKANSIIDWRSTNLISTTDDLLAISGIGPATVDAIREHVIQP